MNIFRERSLVRSPFDMGAMYVMCYWFVLLIAFSHFLILSTRINLFTGRVTKHAHIHEHA